MKYATEFAMSGIFIFIYEAYITLFNLTTWHRQFILRQFGTSVSKRAGITRQHQIYETEHHSWYTAAKPRHKHLNSFTSEEFAK